MLLAGCSNKQQDLIAFIETTKTQYYPRKFTLKESIEIEHFKYQASLLRSPFLASSRDLSKESIDTLANCFQPQIKRHKSPAENYGLDSLMMSGTLQQEDRMWALIQSTEGHVFRLTIGDYLGIYHGQITRVTPSQISIMELIPDGEGCWTERTSTMELTGK